MKLLKLTLFLAGFALLIGSEIARVYFIMPFPGSQIKDRVEFAYWMHNNMWLVRAVGLALVAIPVFSYLTGRKWPRLITSIVLIFWVIVVYMFNFRFLADKMFYQPNTKRLVIADSSKVDSRKLVLGVNFSEEQKAYPLEIIGYHHQVRDSVGGVPVMITYCTVCRTGRVFSPVVDGVQESFRLVGMDHFNAMFEDDKTKSWWRQVTGEAIVGPRKGASLHELPSEQMALGTWLERYPQSLVLQPDPGFTSQYEGLELFDEGTIGGTLEARDSLSWKEKSWVVGVSLELSAKAYDWNELVISRVINDEIASVPLVLALENDSVTFHAWKIPTELQSWHFAFDRGQQAILEERTNSIFDWSGKCISGELNGIQLEHMQSYQEFWHSWRTFHPNTLQYKPTN